MGFNIRKKINVTDNKNIITTGPNYNRIKKASVIVEIKNIDSVDFKKEKNLDQNKEKHASSYLIIKLSD